MTAAWQQRRYRTAMRNILAVLAAAFLALPAAAQSLSETLEVKILELEAAVLGKDGKPIEGLTREDFEVRVDGKKTDVTNFFAVRRGAITETVTADAPPAANAIPATLPTRLFIFINERHLTQRSLHYGIKALQEYFAEETDVPFTYSLMRYNGSLDVILRPTKDRKKVYEELKAMKLRPTGLERDARDMQAVWSMARVRSVDGARTARLRLAETQQRETEHAITTLRNVIRIAGGMGGRKVLLFVSEGIPWTSVPELYMGTAFAPGRSQHAALHWDMGDAMRVSSDTALRDLAKDAQDHGVAFFTLDPGARSNTSMDKYNLRAPVTMLAAQTGGTVVGNVNEMKRGLELVTDQMSTYYSLGIRAPQKDTAAVEVRVRNHPGAQVISSTRRSMRSREQTVADTVRARLYLSEQQNPLNAKIEVVRPELKDGRCTAVVRISAAPETLTYTPNAKVAMHFALLDDAENQSDVRSLTREFARGATPAEVVAFGVSPRKYVASFAVMDEGSGATSYLQREIDATTCQF